MENKLQLILASQSPRRKELLSLLDIPFKVYSPNIDESLREESPERYVLRMALEKCAAIYQRHGSGALVVGSDTSVVLGDQILGKPSSKEEARTVLRSMSGKEHQVLTGVHARCDRFEINIVETTVVTFFELDDAVIETYLDKSEYLDKAGSYGIQGAAQIFVKKISGSYSNVVGLPIGQLRKKLQAELGVSDIRECFAH